MSQTPQPADTFIIVVPTPFKNEIIETEDGIQDKKAYMRYVVSATEACLPFLIYDLEIWSSWIDFATPDSCRSGKNYPGTQWT